MAASLPIDAAQLKAEVQRLLLGGSLVAARVVALVALAPFFGGRAVPAQARLMLGLALAAALGPLALPAGTPLPQSSILHALLLLKEAAIGAAMGFAASLMFHAAEAAGQLSDSGRGASSIEVSAPQLEGHTSPLGSLYLQLSVLLFLGLGGHRAVLLALAESYQVLPAAALPPLTALAPLAELSLRLTAEVLVMALLWAAPVLLASFLADVVLGLAARVNPGLPVYYVGMPLKATAGLAVALLGLTVVAGELGRHAAPVIAAVRQVSRLLGAPP
jgi:flagellar biosynthetic protein FliR